MNDEVRQDGFALAQLLRDSGIAAQTDYQQRSLKSQFKLADRLGAQVVVILGPDELEAGNVRVRDMASHEEQLVPKDVAAGVVKDILG